MHREISHANGHFEQESPLSLYLLTALLALLIGADVWPFIARWIAEWGPRLPTWSNEISGYRLALLAAVIGGARTLYGSLDALLQGRLGADLALAIATIAAILLREPLVAAEIVFIGMVGECLESFTFERTQRAVRQIVEICPRRCWRIRDGQEERVFAADLQVGDLVVVKPGARIPADGIVREGRSSVDVSALTGESLPVDRGPGEEVLAGSLNQLGALTIEAVRVAEHTVVGQVIELTSQALKNKATVERTADRLARYFLPAVLGLAALTFFGAMMLHNWFRAADAPALAWRDLIRLGAYPALSVLVVACPCALILATPAAVIAALGRLAGTGILIKGGVALERLAAVNAFAFDKTGTLTEGRLELGDVVSLSDLDENAVLRLAATAEQQSEHLLARLILQESSQRGFTLDPLVEFQAHPGAGVEAKTASSTVLVGNRRLLEERGVGLSPQALEALERLDASGQTGLLVASGRPGSMTLAGLIGVRDRVRPEAVDVVAQLRALDIEHVAMLTGDREAVAGSVAGHLGISTIRAEVLPQEKAKFIADWQAEGKRVAMVGDGINDAPALARADVGLALGGTGTDVAAEAGDVVFMGDPLRNLPLLLRLSRHTVHIIRQNIIWFAFIVNAIGVVVTAWLWPLLTPSTWYEESPLAAVIYHQLGSLAVLLNAMRLLWFERKASPALQRWKGRVEGLNAWMERWLNVDEGLHWVTHHWKGVAVSLLVLFILLIPVSGLTQIGPDEIGIVRRFGKPLPDDLEPGLHWTWPWPIDTVTRVAPARARNLEIGYRLIESGAASREVRSWASSHQAEGTRRIPDEAVMLTGDRNLIELQGTLRYSLAEPHIYLLEVREPEQILRSTTESVLRDIVASRTFAELLTTDRKAFQEQALALLRERLREQHPDSLGVKLEALSLHDIHPPQEVVQAYYNVAAAIQKKQQRINQAEADALRRIADQYGRNLALINEAMAERYEKERLAQARKEAFMHRAEARTRLAPLTEISLFLDSLADIEAGKSPEDVAEAYRRRRTAARAQQALVMEFRLASEALSVAMGGREKMILDTDRLPSWFQLWLLLGDKRQPPIIPPREPGLPERSPLER